VHSHPVALAACRRWLSPTSPRPNASRDVDRPGRQQVAAGLAGAERRSSTRWQPSATASSTSRATSPTWRQLDPVRGHRAHAAAPTGWDKTSLVVFIDENRPGALLQLLEIFAERDLNLTKIESRPTKAELGEYCFFLDVEGHLADERVGDALAAVKRTHRDVKILGSYRRSGARRPTRPTASPATTPRTASRRRGSATGGPASGAESAAPVVVRRAGSGRSSRRAVTRGRASRRARGPRSRR
jgi:prephenate dehydratase